MIFIDPKRIELNVFEGLPHLVVPVVTNPKQAAAALAWSVEEMERRFDLLSQAKVRNIAAYHSQIKKSLPYLIIIIDELADLMMIAPREVEDSICRLAQLGRAVGIHLIVATQRPSSDIITGLIKSNITSRIAFAVSSQVDSRVILDTPGAEKLVGKGDMLFSTPRWLKPRRLQGAYITEAEIERVVNFWREQEQPAYDMEVLETRRLQTVLEDYEDELLEQAAELVIKNKQASVSYLQRKLRLGYARAARLMDMLEEKGIVGPHQGSKPRKVLLSWEEWENIRTWPRRGEH
jgi:S-DNA-T family DNA segregation ATPase FtsK/SpoIIIE